MFLQELAILSSVEVIDDDGSPSASKLFMLWNPPLCLKTVRLLSWSGLPNFYSAFSLFDFI